MKTDIPAYSQVNQIIFTDYCPHPRNFAHLRYIFFHIKKYSIFFKIVRTLSSTKIKIS
jgi:hypothetical protein